MEQKETIEYAAAKAVIETACRAEGISVIVPSQPRGASLQVGRRARGFAISIPANTRWDDLTRTLGILAFLQDLSADLDQTIDCELPSLHDGIQADVEDACRRALEAYRAKAAA